MNALVEHLQRKMMPDELKDLLQLFGGSHHYLPRPENCRELLANRDQTLYQEWLAGAPSWKLCRRYTLSLRQVERILRRLAA